MAAVDLFVVVAGIADDLLPRGMESDHRCRAGSGRQFRSPTDRGVAIFLPYHEWCTFQRCNYCATGAKSTAQLRSRRPFKDTKHNGDAHSTPRRLSRGKTRRASRTRRERTPWLCRLNNQMLECKSEETSEPVFNRIQWGVIETTTDPGLLIVVRKRK